MVQPADVDGYINAAPPAAQSTLRELRRIIHAAVPDAVEKMSYGMPFYEYMGRRLVYFSAAKKHVGVYALVHAEARVPAQLAEHLAHRSTLHLAFDRPLPEAALTTTLRQKAESIRSAPSR